MPSTTTLVPFLKESPVYWVTPWNTSKTKTKGTTPQKPKPNWLTCPSSGTSLFQVPFWSENHTPLRVNPRFLCKRIEQNRNSAFGEMPFTTTGYATALHPKAIHGSYTSLSVSFFESFGWSEGNPKPRPAPLSTGVKSRGQSTSSKGTKGAACPPPVPPAPGIFTGGDGVQSQGPPTLAGRGHRSGKSGALSRILGMGWSLNMAFGPRPDHGTLFPFSGESHLVSWFPQLKRTF